MSRRKLSSSVSPNMVWEQCVKKNVNPVEEMIKLANLRIPLPEGYDEDVLKKMVDRYDIDTSDPKKHHLVPKVADRFDAWKELAQYIAPKLRSSETTTTEDKNITITIRTFDGQKSEVIDLKETKLLE